MVGSEETFRNRKVQQCTVIHETQYNNDLVWLGDDDVYRFTHYSDVEDDDFLKTDGS